MEKLPVQERPATLPSELFYTTGALRKDSDAYDVFAIGDVTVYGDLKMGNVREEDLAAYIVLAANAYPKLVAALRGIVDCARARNVKLDKAAECDAIASAVLRAIGEE